MRPYGLPRDANLAHPDVADIHQYGLKARVGAMPGKGGDTRGIHKNKARKAATRRYFKRAARAQGKRDCHE